ncbi:MAG: putative lipid II flippase FtsW [Magnetococcales bacterium]|nr:putative lipid II flippase FtsW [Magnetococcales bacterium]
MSSSTYQQTIARPQTVSIKKPTGQTLGNIDIWLASIAFLLLVFGLVMVFSASSPIALRKFNDPTHYALRNGLFALIGIIVMAVLSRTPVPVIRQLGRVGFWITIVMLAVALIPGVGLEGGGARRWLNLQFFTLQPSEPFKVMLVLYIAHLLAENPDRVRNLKEGIIPILAIFALAAVLLLMEPDFGTTVISGAIVIGMIFIAGVPAAWVVSLIAGAIPLAIAGIVMAPYRFRRVTSFLDPWDDPLDSDFQLVQSLLSFGNGGLNGTGLGEGQQKQFYLPEAHTDFIFAIIGEELGLIWIFLVIFLFALLVWRAFSIAQLSKDLFVRLSATGLSILLGAQAIANMGVVMGLLPPKGLTLPLVSYGGTSLIITLAAIGLLLAFSRTVNQEQRDKKIPVRKLAK